MSGFAPMMSEEQKAEIAQAQKTDEIKLQLKELDAQAIRPLRAILTNSGTDEDKEILKNIEAQAGALREELSSFL